MKSLNLALYIAAFAGTACLGGTVPAYKLNQAAAISGVTGGGGLPPEAIAAHTIIDELGNVVFNGRSGSDSTAIAAGATPSFAPINGQSTFTYVPAQAATFAATTTTAVTGKTYRLLITTSGTTSYTLTFGTGFTSVGTLETGTISGVVYALEFIYDGTTFRELVRRRQGSSVVALTAASPTLLGWGDGINTYTLTPTGSVSINAAVVGRAGTEFDLIILTSGTSSFTQTFNTGFKTTGTLATGTVTAKTFIIGFKSDGTSWVERYRTTAQ